MPISAVIRQRKPPNDLCVTHGLPTARDYDLETLLRKGYVEAADDQSVSPYRLTAKGTEFISKRGAGLNEA